MSDSNTIPPELFRSIISHIEDRPTLVALALTCHFVLIDARRQLYRILSSSISSSFAVRRRNTRPTLQHVALLRTLNTYPFLGSLVRFYHTSDLILPYEPPLWELLVGALRQMPRLKTLRFRAFGGAPCAELLLGMPFQLEYLWWGNHSDEKTMGKVLEQQMRLKSVGLETAWGMQWAYPTNVCPDLVALEGNRGTLEALLPGRTVTTLAWVPELGDPRNFPLDEGVRMALGKVRTLSFGGYFARPRLDTIIDCIGEVKDLELVGYDLDELHLLAKLPHLSRLVLSLGRGPHDVPPISGPARRIFMQDIFKRCPCLISIDIGHDWSKINEVWYQRWMRSTVGAAPMYVLFPMKEVRVSGAENFGS